MSVTEILSGTDKSDRSDHHNDQPYLGRRLAGLLAGLATITAISITLWHEPNPPTTPTTPTPSGPPPAYLPGGSVYEQQVPSGPPAAYLPGGSVYEQQVPRSG